MLGDVVFFERGILVDVGVGQIGRREALALAFAIDESAGIDGDMFVGDIAFDMAFGKHMHTAGVNIADDMAMQVELFGDDIAFDMCVFVNGQNFGVDITDDAPVDLDFALRGDVAMKLSVCADDARQIIIFIPRFRKHIFQPL